jgi:hypothetical protein
MADQKNSRDYLVGRGKPPKHTRFTKGQSGNPKGRPKGAKSFATEILEELDARIRITENGKLRKITKRRAVAKQLVNKSVAGDPKTMPTLLNQIHLSEGVSESSPTVDVLSQPEDTLVMENIIKRIRETPDDAEGPGGAAMASDRKEIGEGAEP